ncbi:hypothetical protein NDU88_009925 [Pleurodeles waltl]|uniref:Uncharacterized protein n=1 Tax=Pleurodeles waltl TaxID=8319 RepID=A0AAV7S0E2_PLEWA|nr:hypothetical protein NDU88_009925 [Pleurodeles waltl]
MSTSDGQEQDRHANYEVEIPTSPGVLIVVAPWDIQLPSRPCLFCGIRSVPLDNFHTSEPLRVGRKRTVEMRSYSVAALRRVPRPIYRVDLSVSAYCTRPSMSVSSAGFSTFSSRGTVSPPSFP